MADATFYYTGLRCCRDALWRHDAVDKHWSLYRYAIQNRGRRCYVTVAIFTVLLYPVWKDMNHRTTQTVNKDNLKWLEVTEVSYSNSWMRNSPVCTGAIHTHKHYWYGLRKKKADDLYSCWRIATVSQFLSTSIIMIMLNIHEHVPYKLISMKPHYVQYSFKGPFRDP